MSIAARVIDPPAVYPGAECARVFETCAGFTVPGLGNIAVLIPLRRLPERIAAGQRGTVRRVWCAEKSCHIFEWEAEDENNA